MDGNKRAQPGINSMTEAEHSALAQQHVVAQANNDGDAHLRQDGVAQAAGKNQRSDDDYQGKQTPHPQAATAWVAAGGLSGRI